MVIELVAVPVLGPKEARVSSGTFAVSVLLTAACKYTGTGKNMAKNTERSLINVPQ
jgi:hypothetical protein